MSQKAKQTKDTNRGTLKTSVSKTATKVSAANFLSGNSGDKEEPVVTKVEPVIAKVEATGPKIPENVVSDYNNIGTAVTMARSSGVNEVLVTEHVLRNLLGHRYKNAAYMVYHNVWLYDYAKIDASKKVDLMSIQDKVFGHSKVGIGNGSVLDSSQGVANE